MWILYPAGNPAVRWLKLLSALLIALAVALLVQANPTPLARSALILTVHDAISPASNDYIHRGLERARELNAEVVILQLDTPGGLDTSMREIIQDIIASSVPVITYVWPSGARAASAGTYMLYASHLAAMAPGTNLGAATPVQLGGGGLPGMNPPKAPGSPDEKGDDSKKDSDSSDSAPTSAMGKKVLNDSIAYIRSLAEMRGRNVEWADAAVREAASISSEEALAKGVIDIVARDLDDLLAQANGRQVEVNGQNRTLNTANLALESFSPDWRNQLLAVITNPNVAYILMIIGMYGLFFEFVNPGFVLPGVTGAICLLLALYALQILPVNYAGLGLIILGVMFMVGEAFAPSFGVLGIGGLVAFVFGSVILFDGEGGQLQIAYPLIGVVSAVTAAFVLVAARLAISSLRRPVVSGAEEMLGSIGVATEDFSGEGHVHIHGETWRALARQPVARGANVKVVGLEGLILEVEPTTEEH
ncbi:nodulation protein NfeD [Pseudomaricurvus alcaniphilus]|nr:nodulation protein NfeD [Pseudomaricurvus alcaniphilus]